MKGTFALVAIVVIGLGGCQTMGGDESAVLRAKNKVTPALVHIRPVKEVFRQGTQEEVVVAGSGFIISSDGYVVTNEHVAGESKFVRCVLYNKEEVEAEVVGVDKYTDIAVLKLNGGSPHHPAKLGTSVDLEPGQTVLALGSPQGLQRSVSKGIISVTDRYLPDRDEMTSPYNAWIQTDAAINPGNSGGPLINLRGEVVGVNARKFTDADNIGFAIPMDTVKDVIKSLIEKGRVERSWVGAQFQEMTRKTDNPDQKGVIIGDVDPLSPGAEAGLQPGDILLSVNGAPTDARFVEDLPKVRNAVANLAVGQLATFHIQRGTELLDIPVTTTQRGELTEQDVEFEEWGFTAVNLTPAILRRAQLTERIGILVTGIREGGVAATAGLLRGEIILTVDGETVRDIEHFRTLYQERLASAKPMVLLDVKRVTQLRYVLVKQRPAAPLAELEGAVQNAQ